MSLSTLIANKMNAILSKVKHNASSILALIRWMPSTQFCSHASKKAGNIFYGNSSSKQSLLQYTSYSF